MRKLVPILTLALVLLMALPTLSTSHAQRPSGGPLVPWEVIKNAFYNSSYYLQNLEDANVVVLDPGRIVLNNIVDPQNTVAIINTAMNAPCPQCVAAYGGFLFAPSAGSLPGGSTDWGIASLAFDTEFRATDFDGRVVAHIYTTTTQDTSTALPQTSIAFSNTLRLSPYVGQSRQVWNFTFSQVGTYGFGLTPGMLYFFDIELRDLISRGNSVAPFEILSSTDTPGVGYYQGSWARSQTGPYVIMNLHGQRHYAVIKEYPAFPLDFVSIHDDMPPDTVNHVTRQTLALHELGMMRTALLVNFPFGCGLGTSSVPYADNIATVSGAPDNGAYDTSVQNTLEDQGWAEATNGGGLTVDNCPTVSPSNYNEPVLTDISFSPNGDSRSTFCSGVSLGVNTIACSAFVSYSSNSPATQRTNVIYLGATQVQAIPPGQSGLIPNVGGSQSLFQSFRYSTRHVQQMANQYYGYVLSVLNPGGTPGNSSPGHNFTTTGQAIQNLLTDYGFGADIMDPLFNSDYNLADNYMGDSSSSGPYHDCYVFSSLPGASDASGLNVIGLDYYPYRSAVCSHMPDSLSVYVNCETTGCGVTAPDYLYDALQARHLMNKYGTGSQLSTAETLINNVCYDGVGVCINSWTSTAYSTERLGVYLSTLVKLEQLLGPTTTYSITGQGCQSSKGCGSSYSGLLTQRVQDVATTLSKLWVGAGSWSVNQQACGSPLPGAFEEVGTNQILCSPVNIGGFVVGYLPANSPYAAKNPRGGATDFAESAYCALIGAGGGTGCVNMAVENPFGTPTNAESTIVAMMGLLSYYKQMYPGDENLSGAVDIVDATVCSFHYNAFTGGNGNMVLSNRGYMYMCDPAESGQIGIGDVLAIDFYFNTNYSGWHFETGGNFVTGDLSGWTVTPNASDLAVVTSPVPPTAGHSLKIMDDIIPQTIVSQTTLNPTLLYGPFAFSFTFYLPTTFDLNRMSTFPALVVDVGSYEFFLQPSSVSFSSVMYDCWRFAAPGGSISTGCAPSPFFIRDGWNTALLTRDATGITFSLNGSPSAGFTGAFTDTLSTLSFYIRQCGSVYLSQPNLPSCGNGLTGDYYYASSFFLTQAQ